MSSGLINGVGESTARKITDKLGLKSLEIIEKNPERLNEISGLSDKRIEKIVNSYSQNKYTNIHVENASKALIKLIKEYGFILQLVDTLENMRKNNDCCISYALFTLQKRSCW